MPLKEDSFTTSKVLVPYALLAVSIRIPSARDLGPISTYLPTLKSTPHQLHPPITSHVSYPRQPHPAQPKRNQKNSLKPVQKLKHTSFRCPLKGRIIRILQPKTCRCSGHPLEIVEDGPAPGAGDVYVVVVDGLQDGIQVVLDVVLWEGLEGVGLWRECG
jgi:hypothetical protein